jgi:hypothetical protein
MHDLQDSGGGKQALNLPGLLGFVITCIFADLAGFV